MIDNRPHRTCEGSVTESSMHWQALPSARSGGLCGRLNMALNHPEARLRVSEDMGNKTLSLESSLMSPFANDSAKAGWSVGVVELSMSVAALRT